MCQPARHYPTRDAGDALLFDDSFLRLQRSSVLFGALEDIDRDKFDGLRLHMPAGSTDDEAALDDVGEQVDVAVHVLAGRSGRGVICSDKQAFEITDTMVLSEQAAARAICEGQPPGLGEHSRPDTATMDRTGLDLCVREAVEGAGWTYAADDTGRPTFTRSRLSSVEVPWWPLSVTHSVDAPSVLLSHLLLVADDGSTATIVAPKRFIRASSPPASSTEFLLDAAGSEAVKVPNGVDQTFDSAVRLELVSPAARNPVVAPLLDFSWWGSAKWIVLAIAAIFQEKVREVLRRCLGAVARHAGWRKKPDAEPVQTPGRPEKASPTGKADAAAPGGSPATATGPADEA